MIEVGLFHQTGLFVFVEDLCASYKVIYSFKIDLYTYKGKPLLLKVKVY